MSNNENNTGNPFRKLRYLIVDDFENFRLSLRQMLRSFGADHIEVAANGQTAVQRCTYEHFDVILCDYNLGKGKNGQHILEELRHRKLLKRTSLFIMVTAETSKEMVMGAREYQPDAYLTKPINRAMLDKRLGDLVEQRNALLPINREIDLENLPQAITLCRQALQDKPKYKTWLLKTLAELYFQLGDYTHARKIYEDVVSQRKLSWAQLGLARVLLAEQHYDEACSALNALIEEQPDFVEAYDVLAKTLAKQGKAAKAQKMLQKATELSPNALLRHKSLADIATQNQDMETAASAWRTTVTLGTHSVHDSPEHYISLGRSLSDLSDGDQTEVGQNYAGEALRIVSVMEKRFPEAVGVSTKSKLIQARVHAGQGRSREANAALEQAKLDIDPEKLDPDLGLDLAKTYYSVGATQLAEALLGDLAKRFENDPQVLGQIENLLDEPVSFRQKVKARALNRDGIKAFEGENLTDAASAFREALALVPNHAALNLNLIQVILRQIDKQQVGREALQDCKRCLDALSNLPTQHRQYRRYLALKKKIESMNHG
ncbi:MAG: tetratricopeptide repeat protein [Marinobacter sp.]|nr:tetratricopeptide repeat protein [Marinobacter sp.]